MAPRFLETPAHYGIAEVSTSGGAVVTSSMLAATVYFKGSAAAGAETGRALSTAAAVDSRGCGLLLCSFCAAPDVEALWAAAAAAVVAAAAAEAADRGVPSMGTLLLPALEAASLRASTSWQYRWRNPRGDAS